MSTQWVKPGDGSPLIVLQKAAEVGHRDHAELRIRRLIDKWGKYSRTNLSVDLSGGFYGYDMDRIENGMLLGEGGTAL